MEYNNYEEYMRNVLGYAPNAGNNTYYNEIQWNIPNQISNTVEEKSEWYPEIYKIVYPMVRKTCNEYQNLDITEDMIENMTNTIYTNIEVGDSDISITQAQSSQNELRNGDVINPRAKSQIRETRSPKPNNPILRDLIRILILREFFDRRKFPPKPFPGMPGPRPIPGIRPPLF